MRLLGRILGTLVLLVGLVVVAGWALSDRKLSRRFALDDRIPAIPTDAAAIERGKHFGRAISKCVACHGDDLGGKDFIDAGPVGHFWGTNLTRGKGGIGESYTDADWVNAIRRGLRPDGSSILFMPAEEFQHLTDEDLGAIIAWAKNVPPVDRELPASTVGPLGRALYLTGQLPLLAAERVNHTSRPPARLVAAPTAEYGRYLADVGGCTGCHGPGLSGGRIPGTPPQIKPASNLTPTGIGRWSEEDFMRALRTGKRPDGSTIDPFMPWDLTREMTDDEIRAVYAYLRTVPAKEYGNR